jgi:membrane fusion protein, multidrug efflux system
MITETNRNRRTLRRAAVAVAAAAVLAGCGRAGEAAVEGGDDAVLIGAENLLVAQAEEISSTPLFTVIDPASMRLEASIPAAQLGEVRVGMPVRFRVSGYGDSTFTGRITAVNPTADGGTGQVRLYASLPNARGTLVAGLFAEGRVATDLREALSAPLAAVDQRGLRAFVVRLRGGQVERLDVTVGLRDEAAERVEVIGALAAGDTLLLGTAQGITAGSTVRVSAPTDTARAK